MALKTASCVPIDGALPTRHALVFWPCPASPTSPVDRLPRTASVSLQAPSWLTHPCANREGALSRDRVSSLCFLPLTLPQLGRWLLGCSSSFTAPHALLPRNSLFVARAPGRRRRPTSHKMSTKHDDVRKLAPEFATFDDAKVAQMEAITGPSRVVASIDGRAGRTCVSHADRDSIPNRPTRARSTQVEQLVRSRPYSTGAHARKRRGRRVPHGSLVPPSAAGGDQRPRGRVRRRRPRDGRTGRGEVAQRGLEERRLQSV
jgi:hypothetical protein